MWTLLVKKILVGLPGVNISDLILYLSDISRPKDRSVRFVLRRTFLLGVDMSIAIHLSEVRINCRGKSDQEHGLRG